MDHIRNIQEMIDEHKEQMPTGVVTKVMKELQKAYEDKAGLYTLTWTTVEALAHVKEVEDDDPMAIPELHHNTQRLIVKAVDNAPPHPFYGYRTEATLMPNYGTFLSSWLNMKLPHVIPDLNNPGKMVVIHSIEPYETPHPRHSWRCRI